MEILFIEEENFLGEKYYITEVDGKRIMKTLTSDKKQGLENWNETVKGFTNPPKRTILERATIQKD